MPALLLSLLFVCAPETVLEVDGRPIDERELYRFAAREFADTERARALLDQMIQEILVETLARRAGLEVTAEQIEERYRRLDAETRNRSGGEAELDRILAERGISREEFLDGLKVTFLAEELARRAFELPPGRPVPYEKTNLWLAEHLRTAAIVREGLPEDTLVRVEGVPITAARFGKRYLRDLDPRRREAVVREFVDSLLIERAAQRAGIRLETDEVVRELEQAGRRAARRGGLLGDDLDEMLAGAGADLERLARNARVRNRLLMSRLVDLEYGEDGLRRFFEERRDEFVRRFGPTFSLRGLFLRGGTDGAVRARMAPRTYEEAEAELSALRERVRSGAVDLAAVAAARSEHPSRVERGDLGSVRRSDERFRELVDALIERDAAPGDLLVVRTSAGVWLVSVLGRSPPPDFEQLRDEVRRAAAAAIYRRLRDEAEVRRLGPLAEGGALAGR